MIIFQYQLSILYKFQKYKKVKKSREGKQNRYKSKNQILLFKIEKRKPIKNLFRHYKFDSK